MASNSRRQIEAWMKTLDIEGSVLDVGGLFWPAKGRTRTWDVSDYKILDIRKGRKGVQADYVCDLNKDYPVTISQFDNIFLIEVTDHLWDPMKAFGTLSFLSHPGTRLFISSNFLFPHHTGFDCIRLTITGIAKILQETGFKILEVTPRYAVDGGLESAMRKESKVVHHPGVIGFMVIAEKI